MKCLYTSYLYHGIIFIVAITSYLSFLAETIKVSKAEYGEIVNNHRAIYISLDERLSDVKELIVQLSKFDKDKKSPLHEFKRYIHNGFTICRYEEIVQVLEYAELVLQKKAAEEGRKKIKVFERRLREIMQKISNKELYCTTHTIVSKPN